jgi:light-regulated signal transduction histidine kinase (bacteriophytochrome)
LAALASTVSRDRDYSHRANVREGTREVRTLARTFNLMLAQIEEQNRSLQRAHDELEERVRLRTAELHALNKELEAFSYSVSHDLRAPLRHVAGFAELLEEHAGPLLDDQSKSYLSKITTAARRMGKLIDDLLGFSRVGRTALNIRTVDLDAAVQEARQEAEADASPARPIEWVIGALPPIEADPALLHQVLVNLMANAVKYSATREHPRIEIGAADPIDGQVVVFVRDNGVGFDMKYVDKLFGVFQRLHSASDFPGTGIGLANVQRIVMRHGGRVWAEAEIDRGATFYLAWPRSKGAV